MWILQLNDMRMPKVEMMDAVARADTKEELLSLLEREKVEPYSDDRWGKVFRKGGPLEWFNPPFVEHECLVEIGSLEDWLENTRRKWDRMVMRLPESKTL
jgi:hypothetical protein